MLWPNVDSSTTRSVALEVIEMVMEILVVNNKMAKTLLQILNTVKETCGKNVQSDGQSMELKNNFITGSIEFVDNGMFDISILACYI